VDRRDKEETGWRGRMETIWRKEGLKDEEELGRKKEPAVWSSIDTTL
jgi:hypothetical protein